MSFPVTPSLKSNETTEDAPSWHIDAIFYEVSVKTFFDSNHDGIGDFPGLTQKLPYLADLGVTALWLMPFFPSPLRDDGYDIADFRGVHPSLGTMEQFQLFLAAAQGHQLRVVIDLVINHTSEDHPWFQAARNAPPDSPLRNFYVWSDSAQRLGETRAFAARQGRASNWTWDTVANAYYWHRFSQHQPDLNYDHPEVIEEMGRVVRFWFDRGVDAISLSGAPLLIEREKSSSEGLPETHQILGKLRGAEATTTKVLAAAANAWPSEAVAYFGNGNECQLVPQLPLAQRLFLSLRQENRFPLQNILAATPSPPPGCQWLTLLRNHDELTLGFATDEEKDFMYREYAVDSRMRLHAGILRRLAPLLDNSRPRIELLLSLLFSLPGAPLLYYGDEIGMGDNVYQEGRNAIRTPMQWNSDRNGGFSQADFARLIAPPVMDPIYGYQALNVESQQRDSSSQFHAIRRLIGIRKRLPSLSRGSLTWLEPENPHIVAFVRTHENETMLVVANLAASLQPVELDLSPWIGLTPVDVFGRSALPKIGEQPYLLTLAANAYHWLMVQKNPVDVAARLAPTPVKEIANLPTLQLPGDAATLWHENVQQQLEREILPSYLASQRWFGSKGQAIERTRVVEHLPLGERDRDISLVLLEVCYQSGKQDLYFVPLALAFGADAEKIRTTLRRFAIADVETPKQSGLLYDALASDDACRALLEAVDQNTSIPASQGDVCARSTVAYAALRGDKNASLPIVRAAATSSNSLILFGRRLLMKLFRRIEPGVNPDVEIGRYFTTQGAFRPTPQLAGTLEYDRREGGPLTLAIFQAMVPNQGDGWEHVIDELGRYYQRAAGRMRGPDAVVPDSRSVLELADADAPPIVLETIGGYLHAARSLGERTAEMHLALAANQADVAFAPEAFTSHDFKDLVDDILHQGNAALQLVERNLERLPPAIRNEAKQLEKFAPAVFARLGQESPLGSGTHKIRCHGDYHLGQVLRVENDFVILDFEGEPTRSVEDRRAKQSPLKDVAGMLRSYNYAAYAGLFSFAQHHPGDATLLTNWAELWQQWVSASFLKAYLGGTRVAAFLPSSPEELAALLDLFVLDKALYELAYELNNRPDWVRIPLRGILPLMQHPRWKKIDRGVLK